MATKARGSSPAVFAYIIQTVGKGYQLTGDVPKAVKGRIFFGPCKRRMRPEIHQGDYVMGISPSGIGKHRRILLWMRVAEAMSFADAFDRGEHDPIFKAARPRAIHVKPRDLRHFVRGSPDSYKHLPNGTHGKNNGWKRDIKGTRDVMFIGDRSSWIAESDGPTVTEEILALIKPGVWWKGSPTVKNPLTENARGKHARLENQNAQRVIRWISRHIPEQKNRASGFRTSRCADSRVIKVKQLRQTDSC